MVSNVLADYKSEIEGWRADQEKKLRGESSWLSVVGLAWLKEGENSFGSSSNNQVKLPSSVPEKLGLLRLENGKVKVSFSNAEGISINGEKAAAKKDYPMVADIEGKPTEVRIGTVSFFLIKRKNGFGIRIKDSAATARQSFQGRQWYKVDPKFKIEAIWKPFDKPTKIIVPDVLGNENEETSHGVAEFKIDGKIYQITPTTEDKDLFFVFKDATCGKQSYGAARFLYADAPKDGKVILDFNRTINPPCAFTDFATCPLPPKSNHISALITAGEKKPLEKSNH